MWSKLLLLNDSYTWEFRVLKLKIKQQIYSSNIQFSKNCIKIHLNVASDSKYTYILFIPRLSLSPIIQIQISLLQIHRETILSFIKHFFIKNTSHIIKIIYSCFPYSHIVWLFFTNSFLYTHSALQWRLERSRGYCMTRTLMTFTVGCWYEPPTLCLLASSDDTIGQNTRHQRRERTPVEPVTANRVLHLGSRRSSELDPDKEQNLSIFTECHRSGLFASSSTGRALPTRPVISSRATSSLTWPERRHSEVNKYPARGKQTKLAVSSDRAAGVDVLTRTGASEHVPHFRSVCARMCARV